MTTEVIPPGRQGALGKDGARGPQGLCSALSRLPEALPEGRRGQRVVCLGPLHRLVFGPLEFGFVVSIAVFSQILTSETMALAKIVVILMLVQVLRDLRELLARQGLCLLDGLPHDGAGEADSADEA